MTSIIGLLALLVSACGGDDEAPKSLYSEPCSADPDCAQALLCNEAIGICSQPCATQQECRTNLGSPIAACIGGWCQEPCNLTDFMPCGQGTRCIDGIGGATCRAK